MQGLCSPERGHLVHSRPGVQTHGAVMTQSHSRLAPCPPAGLLCAGAGTVTGGDIYHAQEHGVCVRECELLTHN